MCPPPTDPIRPVGPVSGGVYVGRAELPEHVHRRTRRDEEDGDGRRRRRQQQRQQGSRQEVVDPAAEAGTYDDHGRRSGHDGDHAPAHPHVDASA